MLFLLKKKKMQCTGGVLNETSILFNSFHLRSTHGISCTNSIRTIIYVTPFLSLYKKWIQKKEKDMNCVEKLYNMLGGVGTLT